MYNDPNQFSQANNYSLNPGFGQNGPISQFNNLSPYSGSSPMMQANTYGLNPGFVSSMQMPGAWNSGYTGVGGQAQGYQSGGNTVNTNYNGPNGSFTSTNGGAWKDPSGLGPPINNLSGYLGMKGNQASGADFSGYKSQLDSLLTDPNSVQKSAGYQFAMDQGNQAIDRSAAARGMSNSGGVLTELAKYGSGLASQNYNNQVNQLSNVMQGAQNFGVNNGYYNPAQYTPSLGIGTK